MDWTASVDLYCERIGPGFWAEPLNAVSNFAFVAAGLIGAQAARRRGAMDPLIGMLCTLAVAIGIGSFLFHTVAQRWAGLADVIPILLFILLYLYASAQRFFELRWFVAIPATAVAFAAALSLRGAVIALNGGKSLNGSEGYAPAFALLAGAALGLAIMRHPVAGRIALGAGVFALSLTARTVDSSICPTFPVGSHFAWHLLNGTMIGILLLALVHYGRMPGEKVRV